MTPGRRLPRRNVVINPGLKAAQAGRRLVQSTRGASSGIKLGWSKILTRASDCGARIRKTTGRPRTCRICALSLRNYSTSTKSQVDAWLHTSKSAATTATCCRVSAGAEPAAQGCPRTGRTIQDAYAGKTSPQIEGQKPIRIAQNGPYSDVGAICVYQGATTRNQSRMVCLIRSTSSTGMVFM